jgi:DNA-binding NtrC family response regulator
VLPRDHAKTLLVLSRDVELVERVRRAAQVILEKPEPIVVASATACLAALERRQPALLVFDDAVQRGSGPVLLHRIRRSHPELRIVYVAAHHSPDLEIVVRQIGVLFYTSKPINCWEFACLIAAFMGLRVTGPKPGGCEPEAESGGGTLT